MADNLFRTGMVAVTFAVEKICGIVIAFGPSLSAAISRAVVDGKITAANAVVMQSLLDAAQASCVFWKQASGY